MPLAPEDVARWRVLAQKTRGLGDDEDEAYRAVGLLLAEVERLAAPAGTERMSLVGDDGEVASAVRAKRPEDDRLREENDRLRSLLREVEWVEMRDEDVCPVCWQARRQGHTPDCRLAAATQGKAPPTAAEKLLDLAVLGVLDPGGEENFKAFVVALAEWRDRKP